MFPRRHQPINFKAVGIAFVVIVIIFAFMTYVAQAQGIQRYASSIFGSRTDPRAQVDDALFRVYHYNQLRWVQLAPYIINGLRGYITPDSSGEEMFYPVFNRDGKPLIPPEPTTRQRIEKAGGIISTLTGVVLMATGHKKKGAVVLGSGLAALNDSRYGGKIYYPAAPIDLASLDQGVAYQTSTSRYAGRQTQPRNTTGRRPSGGVFATRPNQQSQTRPRVVDPTASSSSQILLGYTVENTSRVWILVEVDGVRLLEPIAPGETQTIQLTFGSHNVRGYAQATSDTGTELVELARRMREDGKGWIFFREGGK